jgi:polysaccharide biosynthesis protein PslG
MWRRVLVLVALVMFVVALWPPAGSLYDLTGEEELPGQLRGLVHWFYTAVRPQPDLAPEAVTAIPPESPFGMNTFLQLEVLPDVRERSLRMLSEAGFTTIRQHFPWEDIEIHGKGDFIDRRNDPAGVDAWAKYDNIVSLAERYNIEIIARLDNPPSWTRALTDTIGSHAPPDDFDHFGDYVAAVVSRYRDQITYFQLWNEPNIYPEWGEQTVNPEAFTELLCTGYRRAKEVNPEAVILAGACSGCTRPERAIASTSSQPRVMVFGPVPLTAG